MWGNSYIDTTGIATHNFTHFIYLQGSILFLLCGPTATQTNSEQYFPTAIENIGGIVQVTQPRLKALCLTCCNSDDTLTKVIISQEGTLSWKAIEWQDLTLEQGVSLGTISSKAQYRKIQNIVYLRGDFGLGTSATENTKIAILPAGYRPEISIYKIIPLTGQRYGRIRIQPNGEIYLDWVSDNTYEHNWYSLDIEFTI